MFMYILTTIKQVIVAIHAPQGDIVFATDNKHEFFPVNLPEEIEKIGALVLSGEAQPVQIEERKVSALYESLVPIAKKIGPAQFIVKFIVENHLAEQETQVKMPDLEVSKPLPKKKRSRHDTYPDPVA